jgi:hypothetical protein
MFYKCKFIPISVHNSQATMALLCRKLATGEVDITLIQEPWIYGDQIRGLPNTSGKLALLDLVLLLDPAFLLGTWFVTLHCQSCAIGM